MTVAAGYRCTGDIQLAVLILCNRLASRIQDHTVRVTQLASDRGRQARFITFTQDI